MDHSTQARRPDHVLINKMKQISQLVNFTIPVDHRGKIKEIEQIPGPFERVEEVLEHESDSDTNHRALGTVLKNIEKRLSELEFRGRIETTRIKALPRYLNTLKSPGELRKLAVTETSVKTTSYNWWENIPKSQKIGSCINKRKLTYHLVDFAVSANHREKVKIARQR